MPSDFPAAFAALRQVLGRHADGLVVLRDTPTDYTVLSPATAPNGKPMWFGAVLAKKSAVTYHLMPLYFNPKLNAQVGPDLLARMQGKTCFNFQRPDAELFAQLETLTAAARAAWQRAGLLAPGKVTAARMAEIVRANGATVPAASARRGAR